MPGIFYYVISYGIIKIDRIAIFPLVNLSAAASSFLKNRLRNEKYFCLDINY